MQEENLLSRLTAALNKEYFAVGKSRVRSWEAIFLIGIVSGFVGGIIWVASQSEEYDFAPAALIISRSVNFESSTTPEIINIEEASTTEISE